MTSPLSVVIPARNEALVIERCLRNLLSDARPGELDIIVVCNSCSDDTASRARLFGKDVNVVETVTPGKVQALNIGDALSSSFPRFYIDADIVVTTHALREVALILKKNPSVVIASPSACIDCSARHWFVRAFFRAWTNLPFFAEGVVGAGVYAFSKRGRSRFDSFPDIIADDGFARLIAAPHERITSTTSKFHISAPTTLSGLITIMSRIRAGQHQLRRMFPELQANETTSPLRSLLFLARSPQLWLCAPVYLGVMMVADLMARRQSASAIATCWPRDESSRLASKARIRLR